jgi:RimJ/RimL family protein N-acetyltransferase
LGQGIGVKLERQPELQGPRVRLRSWRRGDTLSQELWPRYTEPFHSLWNLPRSGSFSYDLDFSRNNWSNRRYAWAIEDYGCRLIGRITLREVDSSQVHARLGISLAQPFVSQGLGTEAMILFLDYYFEDLAFHTLLLDVAAFNQRAVRCYNRLGFQHLESEWRSAGGDPALRLLEDPNYRHLRGYFRQMRFETLVEFYEMELTRERWMSLRIQTT